jgi:anti-anti-sigma factor
MEAHTSTREAATSRSRSSRKDPFVLRFVGALDAANVADALVEIDALVSCGPRGVIVDLRELEHLDSAGVHALLTLTRRVTAMGGEVAVVNAHGQPLVVLDRLALRRLFGL